MTSNRQVSRLEKKRVTGTRYQDSGARNMEAGRFLEIMVYAAALVFVMIVAWYSNPQNFF